MKSTEILLFGLFLITSFWCVKLERELKRKPKVIKNEKVVVTKTLDTLTVNATVYNAEPNQTDDSPFTTASGFVINKNNPEADKIVAVSQDLIKSKWVKYGDTLLVTGVGNLSGYWIVQDCMNKRFTKKIDLLINKETKCAGLWKKILIFKK